MVRQLIVVWAIVPALVLLGFFSGSLIRTQAISGPNPQKPTQPEVAVEAPVEHAAEPTVSSIQPASFETMLSDLKTGGSADDPGAEQDVPENSASGGSVSRADIVAVIRTMFPSAEGESVEAWADTFEGMSLREITEILQQKKQMSDSLDSLLTPSLRTTVADSGSPGQPISSWKSVIRENLRNTWSPGYRRKQIFPIAGLASEEVGIVVVDFTPGNLARTGMPLHVAFAGDQNIWFCLENDQLTRNGAFELLVDRRIGIRTAQGPIAIAESPVIPITAVRTEIDSHGQVFWLDASGARTNCGKVSVGKIEDLYQLTTGDGVVFRLLQRSPVSGIGQQTQTSGEGAVQQDVVPPSQMMISPVTDVFLICGFIELANVQLMEDEKFWKHVIQQDAENE